MDSGLIAPRCPGMTVGEGLSSANCVDYIAPMTKTLEELLEGARTAEPTREQREEQRRSFVYGNTHLENELITREMIEREAVKLAEEGHRWATRKRAHHFCSTTGIGGHGARAPLSTLRFPFSLHPRTIRIERRRARPVREHAAHADLLGEHIQHRQRVAVAVNS